MRVVGIDPSTFTALAMHPQGEQAKIRLLHFEEQVGWKRVQSIARGVANALEELNPDVVYIEGYNIRNKFNLIMMVEIGTMIRNAMFLAGIEWWDVPPTTLKKWATGSGSAKKDDMAVSATERWGFKHPSDDAVDAYCLAMMGNSIQAGEITPKKLKITHGHYRGVKI